MRRVRLFSDLLGDFLNLLRRWNPMDREYCYWQSRFGSCLDCKYFESCPREDEEGDYEG